MAHRQSLPPLKTTSVSHQDDTMDEDSLAESISEHIEIGSDASDDDAADPFGNRHQMDTDHLNKRRQLFGIEDENISSKFGIDNDNLDRLLSGDNIAQHFKVDDRHKDDTDSHGAHQQRSHPDIASKNSSNATSDGDGGGVDKSHNEPETVGDSSGGAAATAASPIASSHAGNDSRNKEVNIQDDDDVILINDNEISIKSLKNLQIKSVATQSNANTSSEVSDLLNENDDSLSMRDIELSESSGGKENSRNAKPKADGHSNDQSHSTNSDRIVIKAIINEAIDQLPMDASPNLDNAGNQSDGNVPDEIDDPDRHGEMNAIINEAIENLPIKQCTRISRDSLSEIPEDDEEMTIEILEITDNPSRANVIEPSDDGQLSRMSEQKKVLTVNLEQNPNRTFNEGLNANNPTMASITSVDDISHNTIENASDSPARPRSDAANLLFENELNVNLMHMQNKIKELQDLSAGKYSCMIQSSSIFGAATTSDGFSSSRRDSLKDQPQSGRDSTSITTNSTEYRTFQDEYFNLNKLGEFHLAIGERDKIIDQLTESLKQSLQIRDQLHDQSERLTQEMHELQKQFADTVEKVGTFRKESLGGAGITAADTINQRLSEITLDLVSGSEYEDDDAYSKAKVGMNASTERDSGHVKASADTFATSMVDVFKTNLSSDELKVFTAVQDKFNEHMRRELETIRRNNHHELLMERNDKEMEINRLKSMISNVKGGSAEIKELRQELDSIHKKEMEDLRMYFERKCSDLEKQYSEEVFSQHSRRHSNDTNSDLSDAEIFGDDLNYSNMKRKSKAGEILASPTHRKITPTNLGEVLSPTRRIIKMTSRSATPSSGDAKIDGKDLEMNADELHEFYRKKIAHINRCHEENLKQMKMRIQRLEERAGDDDYMLTHSPTIDALLNDKRIANIDNKELFVELVREYDHRLEEQVRMARLGMLQELEAHINTLLSETSSEENRWPPELILLREKFTAKSQLEIAQLQIKHEEEMSRLKIDLQKQLNRKQQRNSKFDDGRDLEKCYIERDNLRELCATFRHLLYELAKCVSVCENDLNATLIDELNRYGILPDTEAVSRAGSPHDDINANAAENDLNQSTCSSVLTQNNNNKSVRVKVVPNVSGILSLVEDPLLVSFCCESNSNIEEENIESLFDLNDCLERLKIEADSLLQLSEKLICKKYSNGNDGEKGDCFEEEDGLKRSIMAKLDSNLATDEKFQQLNNAKQRLSLPLFLPSSGSELNVQLNELKNHLVISERKRQEMEQKLANSLVEQNQLSEALRNAKEKLNFYDGQKEDLSEGYGISQLESPQRKPVMISTFSALQERAKPFFAIAPNNTAENVTRMLQLIEDFSRAGDKLIDEEKQIKKDLQEQIDAADKQRKATLNFLDEQAAEREQERDDFTKEIERLNLLLRDKDKDRQMHERMTKETEVLEQQIKELSATIATHKGTNAKLELELKESIDKIYDLRMIICELEAQIKAKNSSENILTEKLNALEVYVHDQSTANESLQLEVDSLKTEVTPAYEEKIMKLEEQIKSLQLSTDQTVVLERITNQLRNIEENIDRKTKKLEDVQVPASGMTTTCSSPSEDVSVKSGDPNVEFVSPRNAKFMAFPIELIQRITDKLAKHTRTEEATIKQIRDLEMQMKSTLDMLNEIQNERDVLQEKVSEQNLRISTLQSRLDEQRQRAEELQRAGTSDLNMRLYDIQTELKLLQETLSSREKQIAVLKNHLTQSKEIIDRQEAEITTLAQNAAHTATAGAETIANEGSSRSGVQRLSELESEMAAKETENKILKQKIRTEMINKLALPDLMETMLADKNDEIDYLKEQLDIKERELTSLSKYRSNFTTFSESGLPKDGEEPEYIRKASTIMPSLFGSVSTKYFSNTEASKENIIELTEEPSTSLKMLSENRIQPSFGETPIIHPRQIHFTSKSSGDATDNSSSIGDNRTEATRHDIFKLETEIINLKSLLEDKRDLVEQIASENGDLKDQLASLENRHDELQKEKIKLEGEIQGLLDLNERLKVMEQRLSEKDEEAANFELKYMKKCNELDAVQLKVKEQLANIEVYKQQLESQNNVISNKDELLSKYEKDMLNYAQNENKQMETISRLQKEIQELRKAPSDSDDTEKVYVNLKVENNRLKDVLAETEAELSEKMIAYEKCLLDIKEHEQTIYHLNDVLTDSKTARSVEEMRIQISQLQDKNNELSEELEGLRLRAHRREHSVSPRPLSIDEITSRVEKELNYSAQLDSSILKAIESDEINSDHEQEKLDIQDQRNQLETSVKMLQEKCERLQDEMTKERKGFTSTREQDANCIETITRRLEAALVQESELNRLLEEERKRNAQLIGQISEQQLQRATFAGTDSALYNSPKGSPRRLVKNGDSVGDGEVVKRLNDEIKLLKSQSEREKERSDDLERVLLREKGRFEKELRDRKEYGDNMKHQLDNKLQESLALQNELQQVQNRLTISLMDIENLQMRIKSLQDAEAYRAARHEKERSESAHNSLLSQELRDKLQTVERERDVLQDRVKALQSDIERSSQRETRLTESLASVAGYNSQNLLSSNNLIVPQQLLVKLKEMNDKLGDNVRENRQLSDTLQFLTDERQMLQKRVGELEQSCTDKEDLEDRANHLFGKYLRTESFRRALVHQKRYLLIVLSTYEANEANVLTMMNGKLGASVKKRRRPTFKAVVLAAIAIERMKFILRRWHTGKRVCAKGIFTHNTPPRRTMSATTIIWGRGDLQVPMKLNHPQSPPSRDRANLLQGRRSTTTLSTDHS